MENLAEITVSTYDGKKFNVLFDPTDTVKQLKEKIKETEEMRP